MVEEKEFTRAQERPSFTKPFALMDNELKGRSNVTKYQAYPEFKDSKNLYDTCLSYAAAYPETLVIRVLAEQEDFFEQKGVSRHEFMTHSINNMCRSIGKHHSNVFRDTTAQIREKDHLNDSIRRLANGGDRFHPYL